MHKQFQKLGLFVSKNSDQEANTKGTDKNIKYLYKKETRSPDKPARRKIKSANDSKIGSPKHSRKSTEEDKYRNKKQKSRESFERKHRRKESQSKNHESETEIFFISPEDIKRHRDKLRGSKENSPSRLREDRKHSGQRSASHDKDPDKKRSQKKEDDIAKLINQYTNKSSDNYEWLTKKEIFKLISTVKDSSKTEATNSNFFKKFFVFDKPDDSQDRAEPITASGKGSKKTHHSDDKNVLHVHVPLRASFDGTAKKNEKISKLPEKKSIDHSVDVVITHNSKKRSSQNKSHDNHNVKKHNTNVNTDVKSATKKKLRPPDDMNKLKFVDLKISPKEIQNEKFSLKESEIAKISKNKVHKSKKDDTVHSTSESKIKTKNKAKEQVELVNVITEEVQTKSRVNPLRHRKCLVKNTFSLVDICPTVISTDPLSRKKKLKAFKKYYKYCNLDQDSETVVSTTYHTFSDSHKLYQEASVDEVCKKQSRKAKKSRLTQEPNLRLQTHVSTVIVESESPKVSNKPIEISKDEERKLKNTKQQKSKIPILNSIAKIVELAKDSPPAPNSRKKSADLFTPNFLKKKNTQKTQSQENIPKETPRSKKEKRLETVEEKGFSRPSSGRSSVIERPNVVKPPRPQSVPSTKKDNFSSRHKEYKPNVGSKESKMSEASSASRGNRNSTDKKPNPRKLSPDTPTALRRQSVDNTQGRAKSPSRLSNEGTSSVWSKGSKRTNTTSLGSKSDTKLSSRNKVPNERKFKTFERSSAKTSLSNSTCGDKSMDSSRNGTSFLLTKSFKDEEKLSRWQKRKTYADAVRRNAITKTQRATALPSQVVEIRYLSVTKNDNIRPLETILSSENKVKEIISLKSSHESAPAVTEPKMTEDNVQQDKEFYKNDLPEPFFELVEDEKFKELFELPTEKALNEILNENHNFLKKDFSFINDIGKSSSSEDNFSSEDLLNSAKTNDWYNFKMADTQSLSEICCYLKNSDGVSNQNLAVSSQDHILDSLSAPGSEESGYETITSRPTSRSFFEKPHIKALLKPHFEVPLDSYSVEIQFKKSSSSTCGMEIRSIESKSLQTSIESLQKSVQIKMSQGKILGVIDYIDINDVNKKEDDQTPANNSLLEVPEQNALVCDYKNKEKIDLEESCGDKTGRNPFEETSKDKLENYEKIKSKTFYENVIERSFQHQNCEPSATENEVIKNRTLKIKSKQKEKNKTFKKKLLFLFCIRGASDE